jgi:hypothetical protein
MTPPYAVGDILRCECGMCAIDNLLVVLRVSAMFSQVRPLFGPDYAAWSVLNTNPGTAVFVKVGHIDDWPEAPDA